MMSNEFFRLLHWREVKFKELSLPAHPHTPYLPGFLEFALLIRETTQKAIIREQIARKAPKIIPAVGELMQSVNNSNIG